MNPKLAPLLGGRSPKQEATVVLISADSIVLQLLHDLGERIDTATIVVDQTGFLDALRRRMDDIATGRATAFEAVRAEQVLRNSQSAAMPTSFEEARELSETQRRFVGLALHNSLTWLWGPPGTGKTWTLTALVEFLHARNERVLILSNTNKAVDQVLLALCRRLGREHVAVARGEIIRVGKIAHPELEREWADAVVPAKIAERLSTGLRQKIEYLRSQQDEAGREQTRMRSLQDAIRGDSCMPPVAPQLCPKFELVPTSRNEVSSSS